MTQRLVMHVGAAKTGSTSLQRVLSSDSGGSDLFVYRCWQSDGSFTDARGAQHGLNGYASSPLRLIELAEWNDAVVVKAAQEIAQLTRSSTLVLSSEGWASDAAEMSQDAMACLKRILTTSGVESEAVLYVRPQAPWLESFYLQFGIWEGFDIEWYALAVRLAGDGFWAKRVAALKELGFSRVTVRHVDDVVSDFMGQVLGVPAGDPWLTGRTAANPRVDLDFLLMALADPRLRPGAHSPHVEFLLERVAGEWALPHRDVPPLMGEDLVEMTENAYADDNRALMSLLSASDAERFEQRASAFRQEREGRATMTRADLMAMDIDPSYREQLVLRSLDEVMRQRFGDGIPGVPPLLVDGPQRATPTKKRSLMQRLTGRIDRG